MVSVTQVSSLTVDMVERLEWDGETNSYRVRGLGLDVDLAGYLANLAGQEVRVMVCRGSRQTWILIETMEVKGDGR